MAAVRTSRHSRMATSEYMTSLSPLHDELALAPAVVAALKEREAALLTVDTIKEDLERKKASLQQLEVSGDPNRGRKVSQYQNEIAALDAALASAEAEYERVKARNEEELVRWQSEKRSEFVRVQKGLTRVSGLLEESNAAVWKEVAGELKDV